MLKGEVNVGDRVITSWGSTRGRIVEIHPNAKSNLLVLKDTGGDLWATRSSLTSEVEYDDYLRKIEERRLAELADDARLTPMRRLVKKITQAEAHAGDTESLIYKEILYWITDIEAIELKEST